MRAKLAMLGFILRDMFSTYHHPVRVAAQDGIMAAGAGLAVQYILLYLDNQNSYGLTYSYPMSSVIVIAAFPGVLAALIGAMGSSHVRGRIYLVRSVRKSWIGTLIATLVPTTVVWFGFSFIGSPLDFESWVAVFAMVGFGLGSFGVRVSGFADPAGVGKMLREGRRVDAKVAVMGMYADQGMDVIPN